MNGVVEHLQDTSSRWAEVNTCPSCEVLQQRLDREAHIQRSVFPVSRLDNQTRLEAFPQLEKSDRIWEPTAFCAQRIYDFLARKIFSRKVAVSGQIKHFGQRFTVGTSFKGLVVQVKLNAQSLEWETYHDYRVIKKCTALPALSTERIQNLSVYQRTKVETLGRL